MLESFGRGWKMITASIRMGWKDKRLLVPSLLTVFSNFFFLTLVGCQGMLFAKDNSQTGQQIASGSHMLLRHLQSGNLAQLGGANGVFDQNTLGQAAQGGGEAVWIGAVFLTLMWLTNRFLEGMTTALVYSHLTEGPGSGKFSLAAKAVLSSLPAIAVLGLVTFLAKTVARWLKGNKGAGIFGFSLTFLANLVQVFWTLAGHLILPAIVIEGTSFWQALKRADRMASGNLLTIGFGEVGVDVICNVCFAGFSAVGIGGFWYAFAQGALLTPLFISAAVLWACTFVLVTASTLYIRAAFYTCLYVWAIEAETVTAVERHRVRPPAPLAAALA
jgi:hypothetical protein